MFLDASASTFNASTFNNVGGNQLNNWHIGHAIVNLHIHVPLREDRLPGSLRFSYLPQVLHKHGLSITSDVESTFGLAISLTNILHRGSLPHSQSLEQQLQTLGQTLCFIKLAIQAYEHTPLGPNLAKVVHPSVQECLVLLREIKDEIANCQENLGETSMLGLSCRVWRSGVDENKLALWKPQISACHEPLQRFLLAVNSVDWMDRGSKLLAGTTSIEKFFSSLRRYLPLLPPIEISKVLVVNHLGQSLLVPTLFCSTWKDFDYIINDFCRNRIGSHFIRRGDYQVIRARDGRMIKPSVFAATIASGMVLELSIVMRRRSSVQENSNVCPRCGKQNPDVAAADGWMNCFDCSGYFQVSTAEKHDDKQNKLQGETRDGQESVGAEMRNEAVRVNGNPEGILSSSPTTDSAPRASHHDVESRENDGAEHFRRISVICDGGVLPHMQQPRIDARSPDVLLDRLPTGSQKAIEFCERIQTARMSFERWCRAKPFPGHPEIAATRDFVAAVDASVKMAYRGIIFAGDFVELCGIVQTRSAVDVCEFIDEMRDVGQAAHEGTEDTYRKFRAVREALFRIIRESKTIQDADNLQALDLVYQAMKDIDALLSNIRDFSSWWDHTAADLSCLKDGLFVHDSRVDPVRLAQAKKGWGKVRDQYTEYRFEVDTWKEDYLEIRKEPRSSSWFWR